MISPLSLESLLLALREAGLRVGVTEVARLRQVFALQPDSTDCSVSSGNPYSDSTDCRPSTRS